MKSPILRDIPESFETERLLIRAPRPGDGAERHTAIVESLESLQPWMDWLVPGCPSVEKVEEYCRTMHTKYLTREDLLLDLFDKQSGVLVGSSILKGQDWNVPKFELGYWCRQRFQGRGYMTEAIRGTLRFGFETIGAQRIEARCDSRNHRSVRLAERVGLKREGVLRCNKLGVDSTQRDTVLLAMTAADWRQQP